MISCDLVLTPHTSSDTALVYEYSNDGIIIHVVQLDDNVIIDTAAINSMMTMIIAAGCTVEQGFDCLTKQIKLQIRYSIKLKNMQIKLQDQEAASKGNIGDLIHKFEKESKKMINDISKLKNDLIRQESTATQFLSEQLELVSNQFQVEKNKLKSQVERFSGDLDEARLHIIQFKKDHEKDVKAVIKKGKKWLWF